jgi:hypothetical protein
VRAVGELLDAGLKRAERHRRPIDLGRADPLGGRHFGGAHRDAVRLDVVGMPVEAVRVVRDQHLRAGLPDDLEEQPRRLVEVGPPERARVVVRGQAHHAGVAEAAGAAEEPVIGDAERGARDRQLADAVAPELVGLVGGQLRQRRDVDLALFPERAGDERHSGAGGRVERHGRAGPDRLVVGMGVHEENAATSLDARIGAGRGYGMRHDRNSTLRSA